LVAAKQDDSFRVHLPNLIVGEFDHVPEICGRHCLPVGRVRLVQKLEEQAVILPLKDLGHILPELFEHKSPTLRLECCLVMSVDDDVEIWLGQRVVDDRLDHLKPRVGAIHGAHCGVGHQQVSSHGLGPGDGNADVPETARIVGVDLCSCGGQGSRVLGALEYLPEVHASAHGGRRLFGRQPFRRTAAGRATGIAAGVRSTRTRRHRGAAGARATNSCAGPR
jgi:hypothetical protein